MHSLPEGFAIGAAYASDRAGLGVFVILAIALQNIPEGTSVAIPMREAGFSAAQQFWAAVRALPERQRAAIALYYLEDLSIADVAATLGVTEGTVKASLFQARATLAKSLGVSHVGSE